MDTQQHDPARLIDTANAPIFDIDIYDNVADLRAKRCTPELARVRWESATDNSSANPME